MLCFKSKFSRVRWASSLGTATYNYHKKYWVWDKTAIKEIKLEIWLVNCSTATCVNH